MRVYSFLIACLPLVLGPSAVAQQPAAQQRTSVAAWDTVVTRSLLMGSANVALLLADSIPDIGTTSLGAGAVFGKLRRPQMAETEQDITFEAQRYQHIGSWLFHGHFTYQQQQQQDLRWTGIMQPYRGTPFVLADSTVGDWTKHHFALEAGASIPLSERFAAGLAVQYLTSSGAKNRDPRPLSNVNDISLLPSATWKLDARHTIGGHGVFRRFKEDIGIQIRGPFAQGLYRMKGLSFHDQILPISSSYTREYRGTAWSGGLQHLYQTSSSSQWITEVDYTYYTEKTQDGTMPPQSSGDYRSNRLSARTALRYRRGNKENTLSARVSAQRGVGHEYHYVSGIVVFDGDMYTQEDLEAGIAYEWRCRPTHGATYQWYVSPSIDYRQQIASYPTSPLASKQEFGQLIPSIKGGVWTTRQLEITGAFCFQTTVSQLLDYHTNEQTVASVLLFPDYDYQTADYIDATLGLRYVFSNSWRQAQRRQFFVAFSSTLRHRLDTVVYTAYGSNRSYSGLTVGMYY